MIHAAVDLGIQIDYGNDEPGMTLQRFEKPGWHDYLVDGAPVKSPVDIENLPSGEYRLQANAAGLTCKKRTCYLLPM